VFRDNSAVGSLSITAPKATIQPMTQNELKEIVDRLDATRDIFRQNREMQEVLSRREAETSRLQNRNAELEEIMRKFAPTILNAATAMGLAAKNEKADPKRQP
jgi:hypothetical protein